MQRLISVSDSVFNVFCVKQKVICIICDLCLTGFTVCGTLWDTNTCCHEQSKEPQTSLRRMAEARFLSDINVCLEACSTG